MHPAFSVILFTTLSGAGYGLWFWQALRALIGAHGAPLELPPALALGFLLVTVGLLSSLAHLGQPQRAWRALSQWRSSWLSREGVAALLTYVPAVILLGSALLSFPLGEIARIVSLLALAAGALVTVACTAMIYASLKPVPAWRHMLVLPVYLGFALLTGGLLAASFSLDPAHAWRVPVTLLMATATVILALMKWRYWHALDHAIHLPARSRLLGLPASIEVSRWEAPHTEATYVSREMGFVLARKHRRQLRAIALLVFAALPVALLLLTIAFPAVLRPAMIAASLCCLLGALVERWLFFAEARHMVSVY